MELSIVITSFKEPNIDRAIKAIVTQIIPYDYELVVVAPDDATKKVVEKFKKNYGQVKFFRDPGKGKSFALNLIMKKLTGELIILTDGDVILGENSIKEITKVFEDDNIGVATGRVISTNNKDNMLGYWSHMLCDAGAHSIRQELHDKAEFLECSAYLMALRAKIVNKFPLDVAEDAFIPYIFYKKNYRIAYVPTAQVFVKWPDTFSDWVKQKVRTAKAHETLNKYAPDFPRVKSFKNEIVQGWHRALSYPQTPKEFAWTFPLFAARLYVWANVIADTKLKQQHYRDAWDRIDSAR
ncbi:MAG: glycosyltransferase family 2 protein [Nanoarchaeota archaeon]